MAVRCSVAILFILEIDDVFFGNWIPDSTKVRIERFRTSSANNYEDETKLLTSTKQAHTVLITIAIITPVLLIAVFGTWSSKGVVNELPIFICPFAAAYIGVALEVRVTKAKQSIGGIVAAVFIGLFAVVFAMASQHIKKGLYYSDIEGSA